MYRKAECKFFWFLVYVACFIAGAVLMHLFLDIVRGSQEPTITITQEVCNYREGIERAEVFDKYYCDYFDVNQMIWEDTCYVDSYLYTPRFSIGYRIEHCKNMTYTECDRELRSLPCTKNATTYFLQENFQWLNENCEVTCYGCEGNDYGDSADYKCQFNDKIYLVEIE